MGGILIQLRSYIMLLLFWFDRKSLALFVESFEIMNHWKCNSLLLFIDENSCIFWFCSFSVKIFDVYTFQRPCGVKIKSFYNSFWSCTFIVCHIFDVVDWNQIEAFIANFSKNQRSQPERLGQPLANSLKLFDLSLRKELSSMLPQTIWDD